MQQVPIRRWVLTLALSFTAASASMADSTAAEQPLYDRLGGWEGIEAVVQDTIAYHKANPDIAHYFADVDEAMLAGHVTAFFAAGTGGPRAQG